MLPPAKEAAAIFDRLRAAVAEKSADRATLDADCARLERLSRTEGPGSRAAVLRLIAAAKGN